MSQPEERETVANYFLAHPPGRILDVPSGNLWLSSQLVERGFECHCADLFVGAQERPGLHFRVANMNERMPYDDEFFDYVASVEGVEHMESTHHLLREFARVLRPGGKLFLTTPNVLNFKSRLRYLLRGTPFGFPHYARPMEPGEHVHLNPVTLSQLNFAALSAGLEIEQVHTFPLRRKNYVYIPGAMLLWLFTHLGLWFKRRDDQLSRLHRRLMTKTLLLSDVLMVSFRKPSSPK